MGSSNEKTKEENEFQKKLLDELKSQFEMIKKLYEEKLNSFEEEKKTKEKEKKERENEKNEAKQYLNKALEIELDKEIQIIIKEIENLSKIWYMDEIMEIYFKKIITDCYQQLFQSEKIFENLENYIRELTKNLIKKKK